MKIVIIDYGMGNLMSIKSAFQYLGVEDVVISHNHREIINDADKLLLPGVGSFNKAMNSIRELGLDTTLRQAVIDQGKPILGICLGMQLLSKSSNEDGYSEGLGFINSNCKRFSTEGLKIPHVGFNQLKVNGDSKLFQGLPKLSDFYFTHSYRMNLSSSDLKQSICSYGEDFIAAFEHENITGTQFHPELSQTNGLTLLKNFIDKF